MYVASNEESKSSSTNWPHSPLNTPKMIRCRIRGLRSQISSSKTKFCNRGMWRILSPICHLRAIPYSISTPCQPHQRICLRRNRTMKALQESSDCCHWKQLQSDIWALRLACLSLSSLRRSCSTFLPTKMVLYLRKIPGTANSKIAALFPTWKQPSNLYSPK